MNFVWNTLFYFEELPIMIGLRLFPVILIGIKI
jgi:hypothetical protein